LRDAVKDAGISDQTYYQWKKAIASAPEATAPVNDEFAEFIQLEEENRRLRRLLAEKLRAENADLRRSGTILPSKAPAITPNIFLRPHENTSVVWQLTIRWQPFVPPSCS
jgi:hypothetical protein